MPPLLLAATPAADPAPGWRFVDGAARDGCPMTALRAVELGDAPVTPPAGSKFGSVALGTGGRRRPGRRGQPAAGPPVRVVAC